MKTLSDVMSHDVEVILPSATLQEVAFKMRDYDTGVLPVCDGDRISGMVTDRDLVIRGLAERRNPAKTYARDVMTRGVHYCFEDDSVESAARRMQEQQIRRLIVLDRKKRLVGIVSLGDLATESGDEELSGETLKSVSGRGFSASILHPSKKRGFFQTALSVLGTGIGLFALFGAYQWYRESSEQPEIQEAA